jgi:hypothetical protein
VEGAHHFRTRRLFFAVVQSIDTMQATILLTVNVSFLDVPGVESEGPSQSLTQVFSSISLVLCAASAILGLILVRQQRTKRIGTADEAVRLPLLERRCTSNVL